jgi:multidrug transporter EmrE-like cation transporter
MVTNALASLMLKYFANASSKLPSLLSAQVFLHIDVLALLFGSLFFYGLSFFLYFLVLKSVPVAQAYTMITFGAQALLIGGGILFFGDRLSMLGWIGTGVILTGWVLVYLSSSNA